MAEIVGVVERLWRYPVKSTAGERLSEVAVDDRGLAGDRLYAVRDGEGRFGSGKNTRRFRRMDGLLRLGSRLGRRLDGPELLDPLGRTVADPDAFLRAYLQREDVGLAREDAVSHFDQLPVSLLTTATLDWVREAVPTALVDERRFRPNILLRTPPGTRPFVEDDWLGREAALKSGARLRFVRSSERCVMATAAQPGLPHAPEILRVLAKEHDNRLDALAMVSAPGLLRVGDRLRLL
ncbi:MOSC N-terminal beta barrel domain-containing protein [Kitasatospora sp. NBC_01287]|uniref:MOSC domain-containing protein n=1 Tax=Kitasatospora sp. NBC_01287 TaxID=2903573 RepID=UPI00224E103F|nr:MOSC N-terminal beta barrel domain-containing protein [Kitasatospora sp. NBC_01287]MCX4748368.1 MOSC N-terminal beta barrel domain-containing protein [Kitasatospora sp. NBC_01287]